MFQPSPPVLVSLRAAVCSWHSFHRGAEQSHSAASLPGLNENAAKIGATGMPLLKATGALLPPSYCGDYGHEPYTYRAHCGACWRGFTSARESVHWPTSKELVNIKSFLVPEMAQYRAGSINLESATSTSIALWHFYYVKMNYPSKELLLGDGVDAGAGRVMHKKCR